MYASGSALERFAEVRAKDDATDPTGALRELAEQGRLTGRELAVSLGWATRERWEWCMSLPDGWASVS